MRTKTLTASLLALAATGLTAFAFADDLGGNPNAGRAMDQARQVVRQAEGTEASNADGSLKVAEKGAHGSPATVGEMAPDFTLVDQMGQTHTLAQHKGKVVVLEWFNDECPFVKKWYSTGEMNKLAAKYPDVVWLAVNSTKHHDAAHNKQIAADWKMERPILDDSAGHVGHQYEAKTTPHMYVVDAEGKLVYAGAIDSKSSPNAADIGASGTENYVAGVLDKLTSGESVQARSTKPYGCSVKYAAK